MVVTVHLHTLLQRETPEGMQRKLDVTMLSGSSMADLMANLGVEMPLEALLLVANGRLTEPTYLLQEGDQIHLMPAISGGSGAIKQHLPGTAAPLLKY